MKKQSLNLLIIEDESVLLKKYQAYTETLFDRVFATTSLNEAEHILNQEEISCVLSDNRLPDGRGIDLIKALREKELDIPVIVITAYADKELAVSAINLKVTHFLEKPVGREQITTVLKQTIDLIKKSQKIFELEQQFQVSDTARKALCNEYDISPRELDVIETLLVSPSNKAVAEKLFISPGTVKNHLANIFQKTHLGSKEELRALILKLNQQEEK